MSYVSQAALDILNNNPSWIASLWPMIKTTFRTDIQRDSSTWNTIQNSPFLSISDKQAALAFCSMMAFEMKLYGSSTGWTLGELLLAPVLSCGQYGKLALELYNFIDPFGANNAPGNIDYNASDVIAITLGWNGGSAGNHSQFIVKHLGYPDLLCDPTCGLLAVGVSYNSLLKGAFVPSVNMWDLWTIFDYPTRTNISGFLASTKTALNGQYNPMDLIYYIPGLENLKYWGGTARCTPQAWNLGMLR